MTPPARADSCPTQTAAGFEPMIDRALLRRNLRQRLAALPAEVRMAAAAHVARHLISLPGLKAGWKIAGYWALPTELPLLIAQVSLQNLGAEYYLPMLGEAHRLRFGRYRGGDPIRPNRFGIPEPALPSEQTLAGDALDCVLLPLTAFDRRGTRIGSGGGWYDRSFDFRLTPAATRPVLVGIAYALQEQPTLAAEAWDVPLDYVVTERELLKCAPASPTPAAS